jgi:hypothetical protein
MNCDQGLRGGVGRLLLLRSDGSQGKVISAWNSLQSCGALQGLSAQAVCSLYTRNGGTNTDSALSSPSFVVGDEWRRRGRRYGTASFCWRISCLRHDDTSLVQVQVQFRVFTRQS